MNVITPIRPAELQALRLRLAAAPAAAAVARRRVRAVIDAWELGVDPDVAVLLTSELVTNAITHQAGGSIMVAVSCCLGELRVDVYDTARAWPALVSAPAEAEAGRGLLLVAALSTSWGVSRTPTGKAVYFTLAPRPDLAGGAGRGP